MRVARVLLGVACVLLGCCSGGACVLLEQGASLSETFVYEAGHLAASPIDYTQPLILSNNLCRLPLLELTRQLEKALQAPVHGPVSSPGPASSAATNATAALPLAGRDRQKGAHLEHHAPLRCLAAAACSSSPSFNTTTTSTSTTSSSFSSSSSSRPRCLAFLPPNLGDAVLILPACHARAETPHHAHERAEQQQQQQQQSEQGDSPSRVSNEGGAGGCEARGPWEKESTSGAEGGLVVYVAPPVGCELPSAADLKKRLLAVSA